MSEKIQERNQNFFKHKSDSILEENSRYMISLRKEKRMKHINEKRKLFQSSSSLKSLMPLLSSSSLSEDSFLSSINRCKEVIELSSEHSEFFSSLEFISEAISKKSEIFPFDKFFDDGIIKIYQHLLLQNDNKQVTNIILNTFLNSFANCDDFVTQCSNFGIMDILINLSQVTSDLSQKNSAVIAIGNMHGGRQEITNYFLMIKYWEILLTFILLKDDELVSNSLWCLSFLYKSPNNPSSEVSIEILKSISTLLNTKKFSIKRELLWLFHYLTKRDPYVIHYFMNRNLHKNLLNIVGESQKELVAPAYYILNNIIRSSMSHTKVLVELGFANKFSVSFQNKGSIYQTYSLRTYSEMLGRGILVVRGLIDDDSFLKFLSEINTNVTANNAVLNGILHLVKMKDMQVNQHLLRIDITRVIIEGECNRDNEGIHTIIKILIELFDFYSHQEMDTYQTLIDYFMNIGGVDFIEKLSDSKSVDIVNDSIAFLRAFYGEQLHDLLKETNHFNFS